MAAIMGAATGGAGGAVGGLAGQIPQPYMQPGAPGGMTGNSGMGQSVLPPGPTPPGLNMGQRLANQAVGAIGPISARAAAAGTGMGIQQAMAPGMPQQNPYGHQTPYWAR